MPHILIAEDDQHISHMLTTLLTGEGYQTTAAFSGTEALFVLAQGAFDLIILDLMLPGKTGEEVLADIRNTLTTPVIVLTARTDKETTVDLLKLGADDYMAKPFDVNELLARVEVQLRRHQVTAPASEEAKKHKSLTLDENIFDAKNPAGEGAGLSKREYEILHLLISHPTKVFTKENIYQSVWGGEFLGDDNTINVHMSKLRGKLGAILPGEELIKTVWGIGFKMA